jgi:hypothetical protein
VHRLSGLPWPEGAVSGPPSGSDMIRFVERSPQLQGRGWIKEERRVVRRLPEKCTW